MIYYFLLFVIYLIILSHVLADEITNTSGYKFTLVTSPVICDYKKKDLEDEYDINYDVVVTCQNRFCTSNGNGVVTTAGLVNITTSGTYIIQGSLYGQVLINANENDYVHLVLDDSVIASDNGPAINGISADKITITINGNNTLSDSSSNQADNRADACLFTNTDLSINGSGSLVVSGNYGDAIRCRKDLKIINANINILNATKKGIKSKNSLCIKNPTIKITSTDTAIKVTRSNKPGKGYIVIDSGNINISTGKDGIHAETHLTINDGYIDIKESKEGLEAQMIDIIGGEIHIISLNDGINASKRKVSLDAEVIMDDAEVRKVVNEIVSENENVYVNIIGGKTYVTVKGDNSDGIDSNGILYIGGEAEVYTSIEGGKIYGDKAALDAERNNAIVDDATVLITAGEALDQQNEKEQKSTSQNDVDKASKLYNNLGQGFIDHLQKLGRLFKREGLGSNGNIYHPYVYTSVSSQNPGTLITIKNNNGEIIATYTPNVGYSTILIISPKMVAGETYTIILGSTIQKVIASEAVTGAITGPSENSSTKVMENIDNISSDNITEVSTNNFSSNSNTNKTTYIEYDHNSVPKTEINDDIIEENNDNNDNKMKDEIDENSNNNLNTETNSNSKNSEETFSEYLERILGMSYDEIEKELDDEKDSKENNINNNVNNINEIYDKEKEKEGEREKSEPPKYFHYDVTQAGQIRNRDNFANNKERK